MPPERKRAEQKPSFDESFNIWTNKVIDAWKGTDVKDFPIFSEGLLGVSDYYRLLTLDRSKSWMMQINRREVAVTALPDYVLRSYVILTTRELYKRASKIEDETSKEAKELNRVAEAILEDNRQALEKDFISTMQDNLAFAKTWKNLHRRYKEKQSILSRSLRLR